MLKIAYSPVYKYRLPEGHRFPMVKYELIPEQLLREGTITTANFFHPVQLSDDDILTTHTSEYLQQLYNLPLPRKLERTIGFPVREDLIERGKHIAQGTLDCARYAKQYGVAINVAGGTHHAFANRGEGFCVFNDFAIAANVLLHQHEFSKILIVDLDVHQGNGTAEIFQNEDRVFTFSMHGAKNYPLRKATSDLDVGLPDGCDDDQYLSSLRQHFAVLIKHVKPDIIFYLAGVDILQTDRLGRLNVSRQGCAERDRYILELCRQRNIPVAVSMGGGYSHKIADIVEAHANTFRIAQEVFF